MTDNNTGSNDGGERKPRSTSFFGALLQRSTSFRGDDEMAVGGEDYPARSLLRSRSMSESSGSGRSDSIAEGVAPNLPKPEQTTQRSRKLSLTSALLGQSFVERQTSFHSHAASDSTTEENSGEPENDTELPLPAKSQENLTQNDHLNRRLLSSFLEKLNMSDPGKSQSATEISTSPESHVFSDDFLMDRICKRLENDKQ